MRAFGHKINLHNMYRWGSKLASGVQSFGKKLSHGLTTAAQVGDVVLGGLSAVAPGVAPIAGAVKAVNTIRDLSNKANVVSSTSGRLQQLFNKRLKTSV